MGRAQYLYGGDLVRSGTVALDSHETNQMPCTILSLVSSQIFKLVEKKQFCSHGHFIVVTRNTSQHSQLHGWLVLLL